MKGGVARYTSNLASALGQLGVGVDVACSRSCPPRDSVHSVLVKGSRRNSDELLNLVSELKPDVVNVQYERGLYEIDTTIKHTLQRMVYGSTLDEFFAKCSVPVVSTL